MIGYVSSGFFKGLASQFSPGSTIILRSCESVNLKKQKNANNLLLKQAKSVEFIKQIVSYHTKRGGSLARIASPGGSNRYRSSYLETGAGDPAQTAAAVYAGTKRLRLLLQSIC